MNERHMAYVCMGSNMGEPETNLARAREVLGSLPGWKIVSSHHVKLPGAVLGNTCGTVCSYWSGMVRSS